MFSGKRAEIRFSVRQQLIFQIIKPKPVTETINF